MILRLLRSGRHARDFLVFSLVGASGYAINLAIFAIAYGAGAGHIGSACLSFGVSVANNFVWNRQLVFRDAAASPARVQAKRYLIVSTTAFLASLCILDGLLVLGAPALLGQAVAIVVVTPISFAGQRLWSFSRRPIDSAVLVEAS